MHEVEIPLASSSDRQFERSIDRAIVKAGLRVTLRGSLGKFPGSIHWHVKNGKKSGTLEITFWPQQHRAWFSIQDARRAEWIDDGLNEILTRLSSE
jgi:hypothetical protein